MLRPATVLGDRSANLPTRDGEVFNDFASGIRSASSQQKQHEDPPRRAAPLGSQGDFVGCSFAGGAFVHLYAEEAVRENGDATRGIYFRG
jgi:hypothetical protein